MDFDESTERRPADYVFFALGFIGFILAAAGIVVSSPGTAFLGGLLLLLCVVVLAARSSVGS